jgi:probable F420-dependent oxidoreductase
VHFSFNLFGGDPRDWPALVIRAEELGYSAVWVSDHLITPTSYDSRYPYDDSGKAPFAPDTALVDPWVAIGHLAAVTSRIQLATGVYILPLRNAFVTARAVATCQYLSRGRVLFGIGTGWMAEEYAAIGEEFDNRGERMDEILEVLSVLWKGEPVEFNGKYHSFGPVLFSPRPEPAVPLIFGGVTGPALRRAARHGAGWYGPNTDLEETLAVVNKLKGMLKRAGRNSDDFQFWSRCFGRPTLENVTRYREAGIDRLTISAWPREAITLDQKLEAMEQLAGDVTGKFA